MFFASRGILSDPMERFFDLYSDTKVIAGVSFTVDAKPAPGESPNFVVVVSLASITCLRFGV